MSSTDSRHDASWIAKEHDVVVLPSVNVSHRWTAVLPYLTHRHHPCHLYYIALTDTQGSNTRRQHTAEYPLERLLIKNVLECGLKSVGHGGKRTEEGGGGRKVVEGAVQVVRVPTWKRVQRASACSSSPPFHHLPDVLRTFSSFLDSLACL